jgi:hypothetical protein
MNVRIVASVAVIAAAAAGQAAADVVTPAWQEPGYVMDEVVVSSPRIVPAWQEPGFVMEEVVVTAPARAVAVNSDSADESSKVLERLLALHERQRQWLREARRRQLEEQADTPTS